MRRTKPVVSACMLLLIGSLSACAPRDAGFGSVQVLLEQRAGLDPQWRQLSGDPAADQLAQELLAQPVGPDEAVEIALLKNADLQARFEDLGIAQAQLVSASLPPNVEFEGDVGSFADGRRSDFGFVATTDLTRLLLLPMRRGVALAGFDAARVETAGLRWNLHTRSATPFTTTRWPNSFWSWNGPFSSPRRRPTTPPSVCMMRATSPRWNW